MRIILYSQGNTEKTRAQATVNTAIKKKVNKNIVKQIFPTEELIVNPLKIEILDAAKTWATKLEQEETVTKAYFTDVDWCIIRDQLTDVITRREIRGAMILTPPCGGYILYHCVYGQKYNGSRYNKVYIERITLGQVKLNGEYDKQK